MKFEGLQTLFSMLFVLAAAAVGGILAMIVTLIVWWFWPITPEFAIAMIFGGFLSTASGMAYRIWRN